ncbi:hypothetical protein MTP03_25440 [Tsukamurella sp. PLM1]|nr:hypothetical protein MTP03_25440 [Tsukamurella sp. PLM1]
MHPEGLQPGGIDRRFMAVAVARDVHPGAVARQLAGQRGVHGVACGRDERDLARVEVTAPVVPGIPAGEQQAVLGVAPVYVDTAALS